jgi:hypothetical protein
MRKTVLTLALLSSVSLSARADIYTYTGTVNNTWSTSGNWTDTTTSSTTATPETSADTANIGIAGGSQTVVYDTGALGALGTLNLTNTGTGTNELDEQKGTFTLANALSLSSANGIDSLFIDGAGEPAPAANSLLSVGGTGISLGTGGELEIHPFVTNASSTSATITGAVDINGGEFNIDEALATTAGNTATSATTILNSNLSMESGTLVIGTTTSQSGDTALTDNRLAVTQNVNITGGTIENGGSGGATLDLEGTTNTITGATFTGTVGLVVLSSNINPTLTVNEVLSQGFTERISNSTPTTNQTLTFTDTNTAATGNVGVINFQPVNNGAQTLQLGSNVIALAATGTTPMTVNQGAFASGGTENLVVDLHGFTYDVTNTTATFTPTASTVTGNSLDWTFTSTGGSVGTLKATSFNLNSAASVTVGPNTVLQSTGGAVASNLTTKAGTFDPTSVFLYTGNAVISTSGSAGGEASIQANATGSGIIGGLQVQNGALDLNQASFAVGGNVSVTNNGGLAINGASAGKLTLASGMNFTANTGATLQFTLSGNAAAGSFDQILSSGGSASFNLNGVTLSFGVSSINTSDTYQIFSGFTGTNSVADLTFIGTNIPSGFTGSLSNTGVLSFTAIAVPEPSTWALMFGGCFLLGLMGWLRRPLEA